MSTTLRLRMRRSVAASVVGFLLAVLVPSHAVADTGDVETFTDPTVDFPTAIVVGPDQNLWFSNFFGQHVSRITTGGDITSFSLGETGVLQSGGLVGAPDGSLWFTGYSGNKLLRLDPTAPDPEATIETFESEVNLINAPVTIIRGQDDHLWYTNFAGDSIGRVDPSAADPADTIEAYVDPAGKIDGPTWLVDDGQAIWFLSSSNNRVGRITYDGQIKTFGNPNWSSLTGITVGPDGAVWLTEGDNQLVSRLTYDGLLHVQHFPVSIADPFSITTGPDGNLWVTNQGGGSLLRLTPFGGSREFDTSDVLAHPGTITTGPDNHLWVTGGEDSEIGRVEAYPFQEFVDVPHESIFDNPLEWGVAEGVLTGFADGTYRPQTQVSRAGLVNTLWRFADSPRGRPAAGFTDVPRGASYGLAVDWAKAEGLVTGYRDRTFRPRDAVTRAQLVTMLWRLAGAPTQTGAIGFNDVPANAVFRTAVAWAKRTGLMTGFADGGFHPQDRVTRGQVAVVLYNLARNPAAWSGHAGAEPTAVLFEN